MDIERAVLGSAGSGACGPGRAGPIGHRRHACPRRRVTRRDGAGPHLPTNLVAHHLKSLQDAGLVVTRPVRGRSPAHLRPPGAGRRWPSRVPRRRTGAPGGFRLHPQLRPLPARRGAVARAAGYPRPRPAPHPAARVHPRAVKVAKRHGLRLDPWAPPTSPTSFARRPRRRRLRQRPRKPGPAGRRLHWSVPDPRPARHRRRLRVRVPDIAARIERLAPVLRPGGDQ